MRLLCLGTIQDEYGRHAPGSYLDLHDVGEAARLVRMGVARYAEVEGSIQASDAQGLAAHTEESEAGKVDEGQGEEPKGLAGSLAEAKIPGINARVLESLQGAGIETLADLATFTAPELMAIDGIGPATADKIVEFFQTGAKG